MFHLMTHAFFKALLFLGGRHRHPRARRRAGHAQDGRPARVPAANVASRSSSARSRSSASRRSPASSRRTRSSLGARRRLVGLPAVRGRAGRRVPDRALHVPDDVPRLRRRAVRVRARALPPARGTRAGRLDAMHGRRARRARGHRRAGSSSRRFWQLLADFLDPVARAARRARPRRRTRVERARRRARPRRDLRSPGCSTPRAACAVPPCAARARCSSTSSTSTSSTTCSSTGRPSRSRARSALRRAAADRRLARATGGARAARRAASAAPRPASSAPTRSRSPRRRRPRPRLPRARDERAG